MCVPNRLRIIDINTVSNDSEQTKFADAIAGHFGVVVRFEVCACASVHVMQMVDDQVWGDFAHVPNI